MKPIYEMLSLGYENLNEEQNKLLNTKKKRKRKKVKKRHLETNIVRIPGLPCGSVVKNLPANIGDTNWISDP